MGSHHTLDARAFGPSRPPIPRAAANSKTFPPWVCVFAPAPPARALMHADPHPVVGIVCLCGPVRAFSQPARLARAPPSSRLKT
jgi:hypothetical protein